MGPGIDYSTSSENRYRMSSDQLGITPARYNQNKEGYRKKIFFMTGIGLSILLLVVLLFFIFGRQQKTGSGNIKDLTSFIKLYQYGNENEKKDVNTNLPANYTYAYKILSEPLTSEEKTQYAEKLISQYKKYDSQDNISALLLLFAGHLEFAEKINKIRTIYARNDENAVKNLVSKYVSVFEKTDIEFIDKSAGYITEYYNSYPTYLEYVKKYGCVNNEKIDLNCEVDMRRDPQHEDLYDIYIKLSSLEKQIDENFTNVSVYLDNAIMQTYKTIVSNKENKK